MCFGTEHCLQNDDVRVGVAQGYLIGKAAPADEVLSGAAARGPAG